MIRRIHWTVCQVIACLLVVINASAAAPSDKPASPLSLPTDELPPFGMLDEAGRLIPVPSLPAPPPGSVDPPPASPAGISMDCAIEGTRAALEAATALKSSIPLEGRQAL